MTDAKLYEVYETWVGPATLSGVRTRRRELVDAGLVEDSGWREVLPSGRHARVWRAR